MHANQFGFCKQKTSTRAIGKIVGKPATNMLQYSQQTGLPSKGGSLEVLPGPILLLSYESEVGLGRVQRKIIVGR